MYTRDKENIDPVPFSQFRNQYESLVTRSFISRILSIEINTILIVISTRKKTVTRDRNARHVRYHHMYTYMDVFI